MTVLANAGPLIALAKLNRLSLLADLFQVVQVPRSVYREVAEQGRARSATDAVTIRLFLEQCGWPILEVPETLALGYTPPVVLDAGERDLLILGQAAPDALLLIDDEVARQEGPPTGPVRPGYSGGASAGPARRPFDPPGSRASTARDRRPARYLDQ